MEDEVETILKAIKDEKLNVPKHVAIILELLCFFGI